MTNPIRELVISVTVDADTSGFKDLDEAQEKTSTGSVALGGVIAGLTLKLFDTAVAAAKAGAAMAVDLVFGTTEAADAVAKTSKQLGIQADQLQRLSGAAKLSGADTATLDKGVRVLTKGLADASLKGTGPAADALATLGLTVEDLAADIEAGEIESVVGKIGDAFNETSPSIERSAALMQLFGGAGTKLRPLLEEGSEGVEALGDQIKNVISDEDLKQFEDLADSTFLVEDAFTDVKNQIAVGLAPAFQDGAKRVSEFIEQNEEFISQDLPAILAAVGDALISVTEFVFETIDAWKEFIGEIDDASERFAMDFPAAVGVATDALNLVDQVATDVGDSVERVVNFILDAVAKLDALKSSVASIKAGLGLDEEATTTRGGAQFLGGGENLALPTQLTPDNDAASLQRIVEGNFTEADKAIARESLPLAKQREATQEAERVSSENAANAEAINAKRAGQAERAARREKTKGQRARAARKRGGGGGGGRAAKPEASVDDLITGAIGAAGGGPSKVSSGTAFAGTMLINVDQSVNITNGPTTVQVDLGNLPDGATLEDVGDEFAARWETQRAAERAATFDFFQTRNLVGSG